VPVTKDEQLALRIAMPGIFICDPDEEEVSNFVNIAQANRLNTPQPGRAEKIATALPGALLLPCYFATKWAIKPWRKGEWTRDLMTKYGYARLDKGNRSRARSVFRSPRQHRLGQREI
jgi:hypothetical protein